MLNPKNQRQNHDNNYNDNKKNNPRTRPNSPLGTLAALVEEGDFEEESDFEKDRPWDNIFELESYHSSDFEEGSDNDYPDSNNDPDKELFAVKQTTRELRPRNDTGKVKKNTNKRVEFKDPPVRRRHKQQVTPMTKTMVSGDTIPPSQPELRPHEVPTENLPHHQTPLVENSPISDIPENVNAKEKETTGIQSVFSQTAFTKEDTPN